MQSIVLTSRRLREASFDESRAFCAIRGASHVSFCLPPYTPAALLRQRVDCADEKLSSFWLLVMGPSSVGISSPAARVVHTIEDCDLDAKSRTLY